MKILFLSRWFPYPPHNGSALRIYNLLRGLSRHYEISLISLIDQAINEPPVELERICADIQVAQYKPYVPTSARAMLGMLSATPRAAVDTFVPRMAELIRQKLDTGGYDLVLASQWNTAAYWRFFMGMPALFEEVELGVFETKRAQAPTVFHRLRHELPLMKLRHYLRRVLPHFGACTVVSDAEAALLGRMVPSYHKVEVVPNCVSVTDYLDVRANPQANTMIFAGSLRYFPNHDAMDWFIREAWPQIEAKVPDARLTITGDLAGLQFPAANNVTMTGFVEDVWPLVASSWISLAPIRVGGGTRLKILEAMALRTPVVSTSKGAEGLCVRADEHLLIADTAKDFAEAVVRLLKDADLRRRLTESAYQLVRERYDWEVIMPGFVRIVERVARGDSCQQPVPSRLSSSQSSVARLDD